MTPAEIDAQAPRALTVLQDLYPVVEVFTERHVELVARALAEAVAQERANSNGSLMPLLEDLEDYFDQRADAEAVGDPARFVGNEAMNYLSRVRSAIRARANGGAK